MNNDNKKRGETELHRKMVNELKNNPGGLTEGELRERLGIPTDRQNQFGRRRRELSQWYQIKRELRGRDVIYKYEGESETPRDSQPINIAVRARILGRDRGTCQMCGRKASEGHRLAVDHKIPREWGGKTEDDNLWTLCEECNGGKKSHFAAHDAALMTQVMNDKSVHKRIGELLKAYDGAPVPGDLIQFVANQDDWKKRTRDLRYLGWKITATKRKNEHGRVKVFYTAHEWKPWPIDPTGWIRDFERERAERNKRLIRDDLDRDED